MGALHSYISSLMNTTDEGINVEELAEDIFEMETVELVPFEIEEPDVMEVMDLTTEPTPQSVHDRRRDFPSVANLTTEYLESIGVYDGDELSTSS